MTTKPVLCVFGECGKGKSTFLNYLLDGYDSGRFISASSFSSVTLELKRQEAKIFNTSTSVVVYDTPGLFAGDFSLDKWMNAVKKFNETFNGIIWVVSALDRAVTLSTSILASSLQFLVQNFKLENVILIITHCDELSTSVDCKSLGKQWIDGVNRGLDRKLVLSKVIAFGTKETAFYKPTTYRQDFEGHAKSLIGSSNMSFQKEINTGRFGQQIITHLGKEMKTPEQLALEKQIAEAKLKAEQERQRVQAEAAQRAQIQAQINAQQAQQQQLRLQIAQRPRQVIIHNSGPDCNIF